MTVTVMSVTVLHQVLGEEVVVMTVDVTTVIDQVVGEGVTGTLGMVGVVVTVKTVTGEMAMVTASEEMTTPSRTVAVGPTPDAVRSVAP